MPTRNVNLTDELDQYILDKVKSGKYENASEVVREALRNQEREERQFADLRTAIHEGMASGIAEGDVIARVRKKLGLPPRTM